MTVWQCQMMAFTCSVAIAAITNITLNYSILLLTLLICHVVSDSLQYVLTSYQYISFH